MVGGATRPGSKVTHAARRSFLFFFFSLGLVEFSLALGAAAAAVTERSSAAEGLSLLPLGL